MEKLAYIEWQTCTCSYTKCCYVSYRWWHKVDKWHTTILIDLVLEYCFIWSNTAIQILQSLFKNSSRLWTVLQPGTSKCFYGYVVGTKDTKLRFWLDMLCGDKRKVEAYCDSDYMDDTETKLCGTECVVFVMGVAIAWKSKAQHNITCLSMNEEYTAIEDLCKEVSFIVQMWNSWRWKLKTDSCVSGQFRGYIYGEHQSDESTNKPSNIYCH